MTRSRRAVALALALALAALGVGVAGWSGSALGGTAPNPNLNDSVLGVAGGLRYSREVSALNTTDHYAEATAGCGPATRHVVGGGWLISGPPANDRHGESQQPVDYTDVDSAPDDGWSSAGFASQAGNLKAFGICELSTTPAYQQITLPDSSGASRSATLKCGSGTGHVIGGGLSIATVESYDIASRPSDGADADHSPDDAWSGRVFDTLGGIGGFHIASVCQPGPVRYAKATRSVKAGHAAGVAVLCPAGTHDGDGGGVISGPAAQVHLAGSFPVDGTDQDSVPDDGWKTFAFNSSPSKQTLTAYAVCLG